MFAAYHPDQSLLAAALSGKHVRIPGASRQVAGRLLQTAYDNGVAAVLNCRVRQGTIHGLAEQDEAKLRRAYFAQCVTDLALNEATRKALDLLAGAGVRSLVLKGTALAIQYYDDTHLRCRCDTDIFIHPTDMAKATAVLATNDFAISGLEHRPYSSCQFAATCRAGEGLIASLDIHWGISNRIPFKNTLHFEECWKARQPLSELGSNAYTLSPLQLLLHACIHRIGHGRNTQRNRLLWLFDLHLIIGSFSSEDFAQFLQLAIEKKVGAICRDALVMSRYFFGTTYPERYLARLARNHRCEPTARLIKASKLRWVLADLMALQTFGKRISFAGELLFPKGSNKQQRLKIRMRTWTQHLLSRIR